MKYVTTESEAITDNIQSVREYD